MLALHLGTLRNVSLLIALPALALMGCSDGPSSDEDVQRVAGDVGALAGTPDAASTITFTTFTDDVGDQAATETRTLIRNARGYQALFGHAPPAAVDFSREWVMFYAAGTKATGGYDASFLVLLRSGPRLLAVTQLISPGAACTVTQAVTTPHVFIKFPAQSGTTAQFYKNDSIDDCVPNLCAAVTCPAGNACDPTTGQCVPNTTPVPCGGLTGAGCPGQGTCTDDPRDGCDPQKGGADCGGVCTCVQNQACAKDAQFDSSPAVCACVPSKPMCGPVCDIYCEFGNVTDANGCLTCACNPPPTDPCATVKCAAGTHCAAGKCVGDSVSCGGFAGKACPGEGKCVDDPSDSCDPAHGGADCTGICSCVETVLCASTERFDSSPSVCACVPVTADPCAQGCPGPAPASVTTMCSDGTTAGPTCAPNASGTCAWTVTRCPTP